MPHDPHHAPNLNGLVRTFMEIGGQTVNKFNASQATLYIGLTLEEVAEMLKAVSTGAITPSEREVMLNYAQSLNALATEFKSGMHRGDVLRCNYTDLLDAAIDTAWVGIGLAYSVSIDAGGAVEEVGRANHDKYPGGVAIRDANGKIQKPHGWRGPDHTPFVSTAAD